MWAKAIAALFSALNWIGQYFSQKQLLDAGEAKQQVQAQEKVEENVQHATEAVTTPDSARTERLRNRFDRSRNPDAG